MWFEHASLPKCNRYRHRISTSFTWKMLFMGKKKKKKKKQEFDRETDTVILITLKLVWSVLRNI